jgi:N6-adenosine-specific RNA methylase IME4
MKFKAIYIDPPWHETDKQWPYPTMTEAELATLDIRGLADSGCHLWVWTRQRDMEQAFRLIRVWGFRFLACISWVKPTGFPGWWAQTTQFILHAYLPPLEMKKRGLKTHFFASSAGHSIKPEEGAQIVEAVSWPPYLEVFARKQREGWVCVGNDLTGRDIREDIRLLKEFEL